MASKPLVDVNSLLARAAAAKKPSKSKSKTPEVQIANLDAEVARWLKANQDIANAEAEKALAEKEILPAAFKARKEACRASGSFESSVVVNGAVLVSSQNKYSAILPEQEEALQAAFGDEWDEMFVKTTEIKLTKKATDDPDALRKIIEAVGVDKFSEYLDVTQVYKPTEKLHHGIVLEEKVDAKATKLQEAGILKPYKHSVKPK
jgi:hypothetical protein